MTNENRIRDAGCSSVSATALTNAGSRESRMPCFRANVARTAAYVTGFQPKQADAVKLNANENPYPPSPAVMKALAALTPEHLRRYPDAQADTFREAAAELNGVERENIICGKGGNDLLSVALRAFCDKDRPVAYPVPTYALYRVLAQLVNCDALEIPFDPLFSLPTGLAATGAALTIVCNPNAPSGSWIQGEELATLADALTGILLIDEAYVDFAPQDCVDLTRDHDNIIILRSLSKGYSLAGLRFGYAIAHRDLVAGLTTVKDSYNVDAIAIALATAAIKDQTYFRDNIERITKQRRFLTEQLRALGFEVLDSHTNFVLAGPRTSSAAAISEQLAQRSVYVRHFDVPGLRDKLRVSIGTEEQNNKLLTALREILSS